MFFGIVCFEEPLKLQECHLWHTRPHSGGRSCPGPQKAQLEALQCGQDEEGFHVSESSHVVKASTSHLLGGLCLSQDASLLWA